MGELGIGTVPPVPNGRVIFQRAVSVPFGAASLAGFRRWAKSADFPDRGRVDYLAGDVEVDMTPESLNAHGDPKMVIGAGLKVEFDARDLGPVFTDRARLSNVPAGLSCEPDVLCLLWTTLESGRARLVRTADGDDWIEVEGSADLVVEVVSPSSERKDTVELRALYHAAGVTEYWIVDARGETSRLDVLVRAQDAYVLQTTDREGFALSPILGRRVRLVRRASRAQVARHRLEIV